ncbi:uncharacterized protein LOC122335335 [Puntigrus tetrazona]|uniref:uncharacterized protein LOC122335335 n=1 Tax=Puntigrus tetrazona TaxID=1606681 RepID=UPI001C89588C|nr:uncharacterized protein LOC122335335 [Puntigrus tetrazona]
MGAKQSGPAENGRTRAYSGSDLPSSNGGGGGGRTAAVAMRFPAHGASGATSSSSSSSAAVASHYTGSRTRSVGGVSGGPGARPQSSINIPSAGAYGSQDSGNSTPEENGGERALNRRSETLDRIFTCSPVASSLRSFVQHCGPFFTDACRCACGERLRRALGNQQVVVVEISDQKARTFPNHKPAVKPDPAARHRCAFRKVSFAGHELGPAVM